LSSHYYLETQKLGLQIDKEPAPQEKKPRSMFERIKGTRLSQNTDLEWREYLEEDLAPEKESPLEYWKAKAKRWPVMASMAKYYLAIPASSAGVERVFSIAGSLGRARRARLLGKNLGSIIMLRQHRKPQLLKRLQETYGIKSSAKRPSKKRM